MLSPPTKLLVFDSGDSIFSNLSAKLDYHDPLLCETPYVYGVHNLVESRKILEKEPNTKWKIVVIARDKGAEQNAIELVTGINAQFTSATNVPILLVTQSTATNHDAIRYRLRNHNTTLLPVDPDINYDLADKSEPITTSEEKKFDDMIDQIVEWSKKNPEKAKAFKRNT